MLLILKANSSLLSKAVSEELQIQDEAEEIFLPIHPKSIPVRGHISVQLAIIVLIHSPSYRTTRF